MQAREGQHVRHIGFLGAVEHRGRERHANAEVVGQFDDVVGISRLDVVEIFGPIDMLERVAHRSEAHTSELQSLMRISYAVFCLKKKNNKTSHIYKYPISNKNTLATQLFAST